MCDAGSSTGFFASGGLDVLCWEQKPFEVRRGDPNTTS